MAMKDVKLAGAAFPGNMLFCLVLFLPSLELQGLLHISPASSAGGTSSQPSTGASFSSSPSVLVAMQRWLRSSSRTARPNPASGCRATTLPRHSRRLPTRRWLALCQLPPRGEAAGCCGPPACKDPYARPFRELVPAGERSQKPAWQIKSRLKQPAGLLEPHPVLLFGQGTSFRGSPKRTVVIIASTLFMGSPLQPRTVPYGCFTWCCRTEAATSGLQG